MPHLNVDLDYFEHRKTKRLVGLLGRGAEVLPIKLWRYCGKYHCEDGELAGYTEQEIESIVEWWGKPGECVKALLLVGFLEKPGASLVVHDWIEQQGHIAALKERNKKNALKRWARVRGEYQQSTTGIPDQCPFPPIPSDTSPPSAAAADGGGDGSEDGDPIENQVRIFLNSEPMVEWNPRNQRDLAKVVRAMGWEFAKRMIDKAIKAKAPPIPYLVGCWERESKAVQAAKPASKPGPRKTVIRGEV